MLLAAAYSTTTNQPLVLLIGEGVYGLVVMITAFQAVERGSIPRARNRIYPATAGYHLFSIARIEFLPRRDNSSILDS